MFLGAKCKKCGIDIAFDIGDMPIDKARNILGKMTMGECPGFHVEIGMITDYYMIDYDNIFNTSEEAKNFAKTLQENKCSA